ncbi:MAG: 16S rRNA (cytosine(1402)-N(4))-methyltransferase RsmH [Lentisphaeria bacterium]|nr:16S rRNA (cytosine(1402)-N(4))-methyltransferase RsmH [Lentisphaeria bacterium]
MTEWIHQSVLLNEVLEAFPFGEERKLLIDGTLGNGGHSAALLRKYPNLHILGIDRDTDALGRAAQTLAFAKDRVTLVHGNFSDLAGKLQEYGAENADGILLDIGVSSPQLDDPSRGFSWRADGPLDMRMDRTSPENASRLLNRAPEAELAEIFREYGELRSARKLAAAVVETRQKKPFATTLDLVELCDKVLGKSRPGTLPMPTLVFQALRIAVNDELRELRQALQAAMDVLAPGGRLAVISFHSLEDRIVKRFFKEEAASCVCPPGLPVCVCGKQSSLKIITPHALTATDEERTANRRSACAKLRIAEKKEINDNNTNRRRLP